MHRCSSLCIFGIDLAFEKEKIFIANVDDLMYNMNTQRKFDLSIRYLV